MKNETSPWDRQAPGAKYTFSTETIAQLNRQLNGKIKSNGLGMTGLCPCHPDERESFGADLGDTGKLLVRCHAGCNQSALIAKVYDLLGMNQPNYSGNKVRNNAKPSNQKGFQSQDAVTQLEDSRVRRVREPQVNFEWEAFSGDFPSHINHHQYGAPSMVTPYYLADGRVAFISVRWDLTPDKKTIRPRSYGSLKGVRGWHWQQMPAPRPLLKLPELIAQPSKEVLLVEGEKTAVAAESLFPERIVLTWSHGAAAIDKTDWTPLKGRRVILAADNDVAGTNAMKRVEAILSGFACSIRWLNNEAFGKGLPLCKGWDLADAVTDGWTASAVKLVEDSGRLFQQEDATAGLAPMYSFKCDPRGVYRERSGAESTERIYLCSPLEIVGRTTDERDSNYGCLVKYKDLRSQESRTFILPCAVSGGDQSELKSQLLRRGITLFLSDTRTPSCLREYFLSAIQNSDLPWITTVGRTGWQGDTFVLPNEAVGPSSQEFVFIGDESEGPQIKQSGDVDQWRTTVASWARNNNRLVFAISAAFSGPLLEMLNGESGGFHFRGASSTGKTVALAVAASVWGAPAFLQSWRSTANGIEAMAASHSDLALILDEISQISAEELANSLYTLGQGQGKQRATKTGSAQERKTWRVLVLSSGEISHAAHLTAGGKRPFAGHDVRFIDVPADAGKGLGVFDNIHTFPNSSDFAVTLRRSAGEFYGIAGITFLKKLVESKPANKARVVSLIEAFRDGHVKGDGQVARALDRFALVAAAGELATEFGITGWDVGEAIQAARILMADWLDSRGTAGSLEEQQILSQVRLFLEKHAEGRFTLLTAADEKDNRERVTQNRLGYRKVIHKGNCVTEEFWIHREAFINEIAAGFDYRDVLKVLKKNGYLECDAAGKPTSNKYLRAEGKGTRVYVVKGTILSDPLP